MDDHGDGHGGYSGDTYDHGWSALDVWPIVTATLAPLSAALSICSLLALHSYRHRWRALDLFLVTLVVQQLLVAILHFGRAITVLTDASSYSPLVGTDGDAADICPPFVWASITLRTFQVTTLTSSVLDRAFALRWPYAYRVNVRRNQVRYHIVVLAVVSILVGIASTFARLDQQRPLASNRDDQDLQVGSFVWSWSWSSRSSASFCILLPIFLDKKYVLFVSSVHGLMTLLSVIGLVDIMAKSATRQGGASSGAVTPSPSLRVDHVRLPVTSFHDINQKHHHHHHHQQQHYRRPLPTASVPPDMFWSSPAILRVGSVLPLPSSASSSAASASLRRRSTARLVVRRGDLRWPTVASVTVTANLINHLPYLALLIMGRWFNGPSFGLPPSSYLDGATTCLALLEGLLLPVVLWAVDPTYRTAVANSLIRMSRKAGKSPPTSYFGSDRLEVDAFSGLESLSCSTLPRRHASGVGLNRYSPPSIVSTYSSMTSANGYACSSTLDKKVLLTSDSGPRRWTPQPRPSAATASSMTIDDLRLTLKPPDYLASRRTCRPCTFNFDNDHDGDVVIVEKMKFMTQIDRESEEHIYATLTDHLSLTGEKDMAMADDHDVNDEPEIDDDDDSSSFTTSASDDFEFHLTRPVPPPQPANLSKNVSPWQDEAAARATATSSSPSRASTMSIRSSSNKAHSTASDVTELVQKLLANRMKSSSLSMNDLDLLYLSEDEKQTVATAQEIAKSEFGHGGIEPTGHDTLDRPLPTPHLKRTKHASSKSLFDEEPGSNPKRRQYVRNPLLMRARFANRPRPRAPCFVGFYGSNWKYRPTVLPRQDFPWRKSPTQPFRVPPPPLQQKLDSRTTTNVDAHRPPPYRKTFISDFL